MYTIGVWLLLFCDCCVWLSSHAMYPVDRPSIPTAVRVVPLGAGAPHSGSRATTGARASAKYSSMRRVQSLRGPSSYARWALTRLVPCSIRCGANSQRSFKDQDKRGRGDGVIVSAQREAGRERRQSGWAAEGLTLIPGLVADWKKSHPLSSSS